MTNKYTKDAWDLFHSMFKDNEDIVIIDEYDNVYWGKILVEKTNPDLGFYLKRITGSAQFFSWEKIRYMGQDGFPLRKLKGADGSPAIEREQSVEQQLRETIIRQEAIDSVFVPNPRPRRRFRTIFGDPFMVEDCTVELFNSGKYGMKHYLEDEEECLVMKAKDGAVAQLYNLPQIYHMELG